MKKIIKRRNIAKEVRELEAGIAAEKAGVKSVPRWKECAVIPEELKKGKKAYKPFGYVKEDNLKRLIICLTRESAPKTIALVVSYLKPEYVREVLNALPQETQARVAIEMATIHQMGQEEVMAIDKDIKGKIGFLIGGLDHLLKVLDQVDTFTRDNILNSLRGEQPELYERVRKFIILFEDIPNFPDQAMQVITRELKSDSLAKALREAAPEIVNKFFSNMSANASAVLKEEMEYGRPLTKDEIREEREKIINLIKQLENEGKIFIREKPKGLLLESATGTTADKGAEADTSFMEYYNAGVSYYEAGQYNEAAPYFEYCTQMNPANASVYQYLGGTYYALGMTAEAVGAYKKALEIDPNNEELKAWLMAQASK